jgi:hypothetical protein
MGIKRKQDQTTPCPVYPVTVSITKRLQALSCEPAGQDLPLFPATRNGAFPLEGSTRVFPSRQGHAIECSVALSLFRVGIT